MTALSRHILPEERRPKLRLQLGHGRALRFMEAHNPLSAMIATLAETTGPDGYPARFDGLWLSGFSIATSRALPDIELARQERKLETVEEIAAATDLPLIVDVDTGGEPIAFASLCARLETLGVSAVIVEDKVFPKRTSLAAGVSHELEDIDVFTAKIATAKRVTRSKDFLIFARTEALIADRGIAEAIRRAEAFLQSQADGVLIHSKEKSGDDVREFAARYQALVRRLGIDKPLLVVPTAYPQWKESELQAIGVSLVIYGNHQIRAAHAAMTAACESVLRHGRALEAGVAISSVGQLLEQIGTGD